MDGLQAAPAILDDAAPSEFGGIMYLQAGHANLLHFQPRPPGAQVFAHGHGERRGRHLFPTPATGRGRAGPARCHQRKYLRGKMLARVPRLPAEPSETCPGYPRRRVPALHVAHPADQCDGGPIFLAALVPTEQTIVFAISILL